MALRPTWKGFLQLSLVSVPVKGYTAISTADSPVRLNQLHAPCHNRIRYQKTCPEHGEVDSSEIVMGYEFEKNRYVIIDADELEQLRTDKDRAVSIDAFIPADSIDPVYYSGKTYYLLPDGAHAQKPYALLQQGMTEENVCGVAQVVISKREQLVLVRPVENLLAMSVLTYDAGIRKPEMFQEELAESKSTAEELKLTRTLLRGLSREDLDLAQYRDVYEERMQQLIESKVEGKELVAPPQPKAPPVINLMDALKASIKTVKLPTQASAAKKTVATKVAASRAKQARVKATAPRKRKSG